MTTTIQLKQLHPQSSLYLVYLLAPWLLAGTCASALIMLVQSVLDTQSLGGGAQLLDGALAGIGIGLILIGVTRFLYGIFFLRSYRYEIKNENLMISKGVFIKTVGSIPLRRITDLYIKNDWRTVLFGLYTLEALTPSPESKEFASIDGLTRWGALALKERILKLISRSEAAKVRPEVHHAREEHRNFRYETVQKTFNRCDVAFASYP